MRRMDEALQRITEALDVGRDSSQEDWRIVFEECAGADHIETLENVQNVIVENFSFTIEEGAAPYAYYGYLDSENTDGVYKVLADLTGNESKSYGYISNTQGGKILNDFGFNTALQKFADETWDNDGTFIETSSDYFYNNMYDGVAYSGKIVYQGKELQAFNDFFSKNYIEGITSSNINTLFFGEAEKGIFSMNCFGRTEFAAIMENPNIKTINGIDKQLFMTIYDDAVKVLSDREAMDLVCETMKAYEVNNTGNIYFINDGTAIRVVEKDTEGAISLMDAMVRNRKVFFSSIYDFIKKYENSISVIALNSLKDSLEVGTKATMPLLQNNARWLLENPEAEMFAFERLTDSASGNLNEICVSISGKSLSVAEMQEQGYVRYTYGDTEIWINAQRVVTVCKGISMVLLLDSTRRELTYAFNEYGQGNYRTGSKELISYASSLLGGLAGSGIFSLVLAVTGPVGIAATIIGSFMSTIIGAMIGSEAGNVMGDWICDLLGYTDVDYDAACAAIRYRDPLVIDLDGDGFELLSLADGVYFDENAEGFREKTQWVTSDDALLAIDLNGDGIINDGSELFGASTTLVNGSKARSGFEALAQYDENGDGMIDEKDAAYSRLLVWQDRNSDGVSQAEELVSLQEAGIQSTSLSHYDEGGRQVAGITFQDGRTSKLGEFNFEAQLYNTKELEEVEISEEIKALANVRAIGNVASLHTMMQMDESGILRGYVEAFAQADTTIEKEEILTKILYRIAGAENVAAYSRGTWFDARKLIVIEAFMGRDFVGTEGRNPVNRAAPILESVYSDIHELYYNLMNGETALKDYLGMTFWIKDENENRYLDTSLFYVYVDNCRKEGIDMTSAVADMGRYIATINATNRKNYADYVYLYEDDIEYVEAIRNYRPKNVLVGIDEGTTLLADNSGAYLIGVGGNNSLHGWNGNDYLRGGKGNDYLYGGTGKDIYHFELGWGTDTINNYDMSSDRIYDRIEFGEGIHAEDLRLERNESDLIITNKKDGAKIIVRHAYWYADGRYFLEKIGFFDGTEWGLEEIAAKVAETVGTGSDGDDTLVGYGESYKYGRDEKFYGGAGNDEIYGGDGNDLLYGDEGNDYLEGGTGKDTYHFELGWGTDTIYNYDRSSDRIYDRIEFGEGIHAEDLRLERSGNDIVITHLVRGDQIKVLDAYKYADGRTFLEKMGFFDGTEWGLEEIAAKVMETVGTGSDGDDTLNGYTGSYGYSRDEKFYGGAGNDVICGYDGDDELYGGTGDDCLYGGGGDDELYGGAGDDRLEGGAGDDLLYGDEGNDYLEGGTGKDIYHFELGWGTDTINNYDRSSDRIYDRIEFGEGIHAKDLILTRKSKDLIISSIVSSDTITIRNAYYYTDQRCQIDNITFSDGMKGTIDYDRTEILPASGEAMTTPAELITNIPDSVDIESATDTSAAFLTEVLAVETPEEDIVYAEDSVLTDIMAEENSSNMDEATDLQAMLMVQELSGAEDNSICANDMGDNIYDMPLFTEQFAVAEWEVAGGE